MTKVPKLKPESYDKFVYENCDLVKVAEDADGSSSYEVRHIPPVARRRLPIPFGRGITEKSLTWDKLVALARRGEPELLYSFLEECDGLSSKQYSDLARYLSDARGDRLEKVGHRVKQSPETKAHIFTQRWLKERCVMDCVYRELREEKRKAQQRGKKLTKGQLARARTAAIRKYSKEFGTGSNAVQDYIKARKPYRKTSGK
jgi:hypothetical protein